MIPVTVSNDLLPDFTRSTDDICDSNNVPEELVMYSDGTIAHTPDAFVFGVPVRTSATPGTQNDNELSNEL